MSEATAVQPSYEFAIITTKTYQTPGICPHCAVVGQLTFIRALKNDKLNCSVSRCKECHKAIIYMQEPVLPASVLPLFGEWKFKNEMR